MHDRDHDHSAIEFHPIFGRGGSKIKLNLSYFSISYFYELEILSIYHQIALEEDLVNIGSNDLGSMAVFAGDSLASTCCCKQPSRQLRWVYGAHGVGGKRLPTGCAIADPLLAWLNNETEV